jgi:hypothetical protein
MAQAHLEKFQKRASNPVKLGPGGILKTCKDCQGAAAAAALLPSDHGFCPLAVLVQQCILSCWFFVVLLQPTARRTHAPHNLT